MALPATSGRAALIRQVTLIGDELCLD